MAAGLAVVFVIDRLTDTAPVQHLYYLPIVAAAITLELRGAVVTALAAIVCYHLANHYGHPPIEGDSDIAQVAVFLAVGVATAALAHRANGLRQLASTDDLTGLHNLRSFEVHLQRFIALARRRRQVLAVLVLDVDRLKTINDTHGHLAGAEAVRTVGHLIAGVLPSSAVGCRYGGDEFVIAVHSDDAACGPDVASDIARAVHDVAPRLAGQSFPAGTLSVSIGVAVHAFAIDDDRITSDRTLGESLFRDADAALYRAKALGRNRIVRARTGSDRARATSSLQVARRPLNLRKGVSASDGSQ